MNYQEHASNQRYTPPNHGPSHGSKITEHQTLFQTNTTKSPNHRASRTPRDHQSTYQNHTKGKPNPYQILIKSNPYQVKSSIHQIKAKPNQPSPQPKPKKGASKHRTSSQTKPNPSQPHSSINSTNPLLPASNPYRVHKPIKSNRREPDQYRLLNRRSSQNIVSHTYSHLEGDPAPSHPRREPSQPPPPPQKKKRIRVACPRLPKGAMPRYGGRQWVCVVLIRA